MNKSSNKLENKFPPEQTVFLFPGQASQYVGMGKDIYDSSAVVRELYAFASEEIGEDIAKISFEGPAETLKQTRFTQPAILLHSLSALTILDGALEAKFAAGHSLGEYGALVAAGALTAKDAIKLVVKRAALMEISSQEKPGTMAAIIGLDLETVETLCTEISDVKDKVVAANINSPVQIVVSGDVIAVEKLASLAKERGAKRAIILEVGGAFHSHLMQSAQTGMSDALSGVNIQAPKSTFIPNVTAEPVTDPKEIHSLLQKQITSPVRWSQTMDFLKKTDIKTVIEVGPGKVLTGLAKRSLSPELLISLDALADIEAYLSPEPAQ